MGAAGFGGSFAPIVQHEKWEIHKVFPHFPYFRLGQNLAPNLLVPLCGIALSIVGMLEAEDVTFFHDLALAAQQAMEADAAKAMCVFANK